MENIIIDELTKKKLSTWKRLFIYFIDSLTVIGLFIILFFLIGNKVITTLGEDSVKGINEIYEQECISQDVPYKKSLYGMYQVDKDTYIENIMNLDNTLTYEDAMSLYDNKYYEIDTNIQSYDNYSKYYDSFNKVYYLTLLSSVFLSSFIFLFLIPILNKNRKTLGMMIFKTSLTDDSTNIISNNLKLFARYFTIIGIEISLCYAVANLIGIIFLAIINIILICFTKKKKTIHDFFTKTHLEKDEYSYTA